MEKFELTIVAQGSQSIWIALAVIALLCLTTLAVVYVLCSRYRLASRKQLSIGAQNWPLIGVQF